MLEYGAWLIQELIHYRFGASFNVDHSTLELVKYVMCDDMNHTSKISGSGNALTDLDQHIIDHQRDSQWHFFTIFTLIGWS